MVVGEETLNTLMQSYMVAERLRQSFELPRLVVNNLFTNFERAIGTEYEQIKVMLVATDTDPLSAKVSPKGIIVKGSAEVRVMNPLYDEIPCGIIQLDLTCEVKIEGRSGFKFKGQVESLELDVIDVFPFFNNEVDIEGTQEKLSGI
mmetsp:Transcript_17445/g.29354  ORF Transcript_17445/g.29354 Transcript_17445/m.29354 type:complete len:147 (-) Transcript_17445:248-688(-)